MLNDQNNRLMDQSIPAAPSAPPGYCRAFARLVSPGAGAFANFCAARGPGICQPRGHSRAFDKQAVSYQHITTQRILLRTKADWLICHGHEKIREVCKGMFLILCTHFFIAYQTRITGSEIRNYRRESTFFGYWIKFLLILFEKHSFHIRKTIHNI